MESMLTKSDSCSCSKKTNKYYIIVYFLSLVLFFAFQVLNARHLFAHNGWTAVADCTTPSSSFDSVGADGTTATRDTSSPSQTTTGRRSGVSSVEAAALISQPDVLVAKLLLYALKVSGKQTKKRASVISYLKSSY